MRYNMSQKESKWVKQSQIESKWIKMSLIESESNWIWLSQKEFNLSQNESNRIKIGYIRSKCIISVQMSQNWVKLNQNWLRSEDQWVSHSQNKPVLVTWLKEARQFWKGKCFKNLVSILNWVYKCPTKKYFKVHYRHVRKQKCNWEFLLVGQNSIQHNLKIGATPSSTL